MLQTESASAGHYEKDIWDKLNVLFKVLAASIIAVIGFWGKDYLNKKKEVQLYTELTVNREQADSELRKTMFNTIISDLLNPDPNVIHDRVLALEILAYNFHDVISLNPLFKQLEREITQNSLEERAKKPSEPSTIDWDSLRDRLERVARDVSTKQLAALRDVGIVKNQDVYIDDIDERRNTLAEKHSIEAFGSPKWSYPSGITIMDQELRLPKGQSLAEQSRQFLVQILFVDEDTRQILVHLEVRKTGARIPEIHNTFWVGFSDFPLIDNTRLENGERVAIVLRSWEKDKIVEIGLAYFPGSRASLKERMYYDEILNQLLTSSALAKPELQG